MSWFSFLWSIKMVVHANYRRNYFNFLQLAVSALVSKFERWYSKPINDFSDFHRTVIVSEIFWNKFIRWAKQDYLNLSIFPECFSYDFNSTFAWNDCPLQTHHSEIKLHFRNSTEIIGSISSPPRLNSFEESPFKTIVFWRDPSKQCSRWKN